MDYKKIFQSDDLISLIVLLFTFLFPIYPMILMIGFMVICDSVTGILASRKKGIKFVSGKLRDTADKFISYGIGVLIAYLIQILLIPNFPALKSVTALICYIELKSINENIEIVTGLNLFKGVLTVLNIKNKKGESSK